MLDQRLEGEHDARPALRVHRRPADLRFHSFLNGIINLGRRGQRHTRLHKTGIGIVHIAEAPGYASHRLAVDEVGNLAHPVPLYRD